MSGEVARRKHAAGFVVSECYGGTMRLVQVICTEECGAVQVSEDTLTLFVSSGSPESSHYTFRCSSCGADCIRQADARTIEVLLGHGFAAVPYEPPGELDEQHSGPPISIDDVLDVMNDVDEYNRTGVFSWLN